MSAFLQQFDLIAQPRANAPTIAIKDSIDIAGYQRPLQAARSPIRRPPRVTRKLCSACSMQAGASRAKRTCTSWRSA